MQNLASAWISWHIGLPCPFHGHYLFCDAQANVDVKSLALISMSESFFIHTNCVSEVTGRLGSTNPWAQVMVVLVQI